MNIKKAASKLAKLYEEEKANLPLLPLENGAVAYKNYVIKQDKQGYWAVFKNNNHKLNYVDKFNLKSSACMAARHHSRNDIMGTAEIRNLDSGYWNNHMDSEIFKYRFKNTKDVERRDLFLWRWQITDQRAKFYKQRITAAFSHAFR
jgi:hypothetical protein